MASIQDVMIRSSVAETKSAQARERATALLAELQKEIDARGRELACMQSSVASHTAAESATASALHLQSLHAQLAENEAWNSQQSREVFLASRKLMVAYGVQVVAKVGEAYVTYTTGCTDFSSALGNLTSSAETLASPETRRNLKDQGSSQAMAGADVVSSLVLIKLTLTRCGKTFCDLVNYAKGIRDFAAMDPSKAKVDGLKFFSEVLGHLDTLLTTLDKSARWMKLDHVFSEDEAGKLSKGLVWVKHVVEIVRSVSNTWEQYWDGVAAQASSKDSLQRSNRIIATDFKVARHTADSSIRDAERLKLEIRRLKGVLERREQRLRRILDRMRERLPDLRGARRQLDTLRSELRGATGADALKRYALQSLEQERSNLNLVTTSYERALGTLRR